MRAAEQTSERELDCRGMLCPEPIMKLTGTVRTLGGQPGLIRVQADDPAFSADLRAWARATQAQVASEHQDGSVLRALVLVNGAEPPANATALETASPSPSPSPSPAPLPTRPPRPATLPNADAVQRFELDLRGKQCPVPVMELAKAARKAAGAPAVIRVLADDPAFPKDLEAWCRSAKATQGEAQERDGVHDVTVLIGGATRASMSVAAPLPGPAPHAASTPPPAAPPRREPSVSFVAPPPTRTRTATGSAASPVVLDVELGELDASLAVARLAEAQLRLAPTGGHIVARSASAALAGEVVSWCTLMRCQLMGIHTDVNGLTAEIRVDARPGAVVPAAPAATAPAVGTALMALGEKAPGGCPERLNQATLLLFHDDFDSAMAALLVASGAVAQGMEVKIFFSFWAVALLRAPKPRRNNPDGYASPHKPSFLQRMLKKMLPRGARKAKLSKMNMGGVGRGMMKGIMRKQNIMSLDAMLEQCAELGVKYQVCTMSMGLLGIEPRDLTEFPGMQYLGVASFVEEAKCSSLSMVF